MQYGFRDAIAKVGMVKFVSDLFWIGMFYHLYNQVKQNIWFGWGCVCVGLLHKYTNRMSIFIIRVLGD